MIKTELNRIRLLADLLFLLTLLHGGCLLQQAFLFLRLSLGLVLVKQLEGLSRSVAV